MQIKLFGNSTNEIIEKIKYHFLQQTKEIISKEIIIEIKGGNKTSISDITKICKEISKHFDENTTINLSTFFENEMDLKEVTITTK